MKNRKAYAVICWILSVLFFLSAFLISEGNLENLTKQIIFWLVMGIVWALLGVIHWINGNNKNTN